MDLNLYLPGKPQGISVSSETLDGSQLDQEEYEIGERITLIKSDGILYRVTGEYEKNQKELDLIVYDMSVLP